MDHVVPQGPRWYRFGAVSVARRTRAGASIQIARPVVHQEPPPLDELIEAGKVLALNMSAGTNPALARAIGVMLKNAWLQSLLLRPATMKNELGRYVRPAVFICDEY